MRSTISGEISAPLLSLALLCVTPACAQETAQRAAEPAAPAAPLQIEVGQVFPALVLTNLNAPVATAAPIDLGQSLGRKPVVLMYWIAGNPRSDEALQRLQSLVGELGADNIAAYGLTFPQPGRGPDVIRKRLQQLSIDLPVLEDREFRLGRALQVQSTPFTAIVDREGTLRLSNGASFNQVLELDMTVETAIRRAATKGTLGTYGYLPQYFPVKELVGQPCPDFRAPRVNDSVEQRWHSLLDHEKLNILIFWSVDCPHCRQSLPEINRWFKANSEGLNVITAAQSTDESTRTKTRQFCDVNGFAFPTLIDQDMQVSRLYQITSTPTVLIIRPDGVVDSVMLSTDQSFGELIEEKKRQLL